MKKIVKLESFGDIKSFLKQPTVAIAEALTGILSSNGIVPPQYILSTGRIVQSAIKGKLLMQLGKEIDNYRREGRIRSDYFATHKNQVSLLELLKFIDNDIPDEEIFNAMKAIYFCGIGTNATEKEEEISYQLLLLCKKINSMEILILKTCYNVYLGKYPDINTGTNSFGDWETSISLKIGYGLPELIGASDQKLVDLGLLSPRTYSDKSGIRVGKEFRLTTLGIKLCDYVCTW